MLWNVPHWIKFLNQFHIKSCNSNLEIRYSSAHAPQFQFETIFGVHFIIKIYFILIPQRWVSINFKYIFIIHFYNRLKQLFCLFPLDATKWMIVIISMPLFIISTLAIYLIRKIFTSTPQQIASITFNLISCQTYKKKKKYKLTLFLFLIHVVGFVVCEKLITTCAQDCCFTLNEAIFFF